MSTMLLSIIAYSSFYGWPLAAGIVILILIHELGHGLAAKIMKLDVSAPIFIPFFGALISMKEQPKTSWVESVVGAGGPLAGMCGGIIVLLVSFQIEDPNTQNLFTIIAWFTFVINYFNLMPVFGLDGDRITKPMTFYHWIFSLIVISFLIAMSYHILGNILPFTIFIFILSIVKTYKTYRREKGYLEKKTGLDKLKANDPYLEEHNVSNRQKTCAMILFIGLCTLLNFLYIYTEILRDSIKVH
jgi:Zn-dependent protease